jgi:hypothetical protein
MEDDSDLRMKGRNFSVIFPIDRYKTGSQRSVKFIVNIDRM